MIKYYLILTLLFPLILSCSQNKRSENTAVKTSFKYKELRIDTPFTNGAKIIPLPFWSKGWPKPDKEYITERTDYKLPPIKSVRYINLDSLLRYKCTGGEPIDNNLSKLTTYNYQFPNISKYQVFFKEVSKGSYGNDPLVKFIQKECNMHYTCFGYIILYDQLTKETIALNVYHDYYIDSGHTRNFYIDKNRTIHLIDDGYSDGDEVVNLQNRTLLIFKSGELKISSSQPIK